MQVGLLEISLHLPGVQSLKEKRSILKPLLHRVHKTFNVSVAETDKQDIWQTAVLGIACVSVTAAQAHRLLEQVMQFVDRDSRVLVTDTRLEIL